MEIGENRHLTGMGIYFGENDSRNVSRKLEVDNPTNNIAELKACISAIEFLINQKDFNDNHIHIYTDSEYTINCILKWGKKWEQNGCPVRNMAITITK